MLHCANKVCAFVTSHFSEEAIVFDFTDQVVIVTGAAGNLGQALAAAFGEAGARLVLVDHKPGRLEATFPKLAGNADHYLAAPVDAAQRADVEAMVEETMRRFGRIDVLVNAAGGYAGGATVAESEPALWDDMFSRNLRTVATLCRAVVPHMVDQESGAVINIGSRHAEEGKSKTAAYSAAKSAVVRLTESLAAETKAQGVRANCVLPSTIDSPENRAANPKADPAKWVTAESLAEVILFLASPLARDITGASVPVYGRM
jgi:NAD(P)-dependent dehydrogenase (short-subunit alcohol dehydrogenase family)